jgi:hypothetical protein
MKTPTTEQISKLPVWAQEHIQSLSRLADTQRRAIDAFHDAQTPSPFYTLDYSLSVTNVKPRYFQIDHMGICIEHAGIKADIFLSRPDDSQRPYGIQIGFESLKHERGKPVSISPHGGGSFFLLHKENM